jgi:apyrase
LSVNLTSVSVSAVTESLQKGTLLDPCTPKGYSHNVESLKLSPGSLEDKSKYLATLQSKGNFSECRSAALTLLQKGKGY